MIGAFLQDSTPENNPAQAEEIQRYYKFHVNPVGDEWVASKLNEFSIGATPSAAITACAIEIVKNN